MSRVSGANALRALKAFHTLVWAFFAACIVAIPFASRSGQHEVALWLVALVFMEVLILLFNRWRCPLTDLAAKYTEDRRENFDIYLPRLIAKYNKHIFGPLYVAAALYALAMWSS